MSSNAVGNSNGPHYKVIDQCQDSKRLMTIEALQFSRSKLNTRDEYQSMGLTLKYYVKNASSA